jgi:hypothetical protein
MRKIPDSLRIFLITFSLSCSIVAMILTYQGFQRMGDTIKAKNEIISELEYKLLHCKLTTKIEMEENKND